MKNMINITSSQNQVLKEIRSLMSRDKREDTGLFFVEGVRIVEEALSSNARVEYMVVSEGFASGRADICKKLTAGGSMKTYMVPDKLFREIADTETPQGIIAVIRMDRRDISAAFSEKGLVVLLDSVRDPGNMGTIIRTADAADFTGVMVSSGCVDVYNPKVIRATMGSIFHIPIYNCGSAAEGIKSARSNSFKVCASHLEGALGIYDADLTPPAVLVVGSEAEGISREARELADCLVRIPMEGRAESLNASVAAGIMMFEAVRQKLSKR